MKKIFAVAMLLVMINNTCAYATTMAHWANLRDENYNLIGTVNTGDYVVACAPDTTCPGRTWIQTASGQYGTVQDVYLYGGTDYEYENPYAYSGSTAPQLDIYQDIYSGYYDYTATQDYYSSLTYDYETNMYVAPETYTAPEATTTTQYEYYYDPYLETYCETYQYSDSSLGYQYAYTTAEPTTTWTASEYGYRIDVNIDKQVVTLYENGNIIHSAQCVTGMKDQWDTPLGEWNIYSKSEDAILTDYNTYEAKVSYWMPFAGGCGFHDATWRGAFGGDIYTYAGSHGCVNLDYYTAQMIYGMCEVGTRVSVH